MDPKQLLLNADQAVSDLQPELARNMLINYIEWRQRGGFQPEMYSNLFGDKFAKQIANRLETLVYQMDLSIEIPDVSVLPRA